jgi:hypothetical protein
MLQIGRSVFARPSLRRAFISAVSQESLLVFSAKTVPPCQTRRCLCSAPVSTADPTFQPVQQTIHTSGFEPRPTAMMSLRNPLVAEDVHLWLATIKSDGLHLTHGMRSVAHDVVCL